MVIPEDFLRITMSRPQIGHHFGISDAFMTRHKRVINIPDASVHIHDAFTMHGTNPWITTRF